MRYRWREFTIPDRELTAGDGALEIVHGLPKIDDRELTVVDIDLTVDDINDCTSVTTFTSPIVVVQSAAANVQPPAEQALETAG